MKNEKDAVHLRRLVVLLLLTITVTTVMTIIRSNSTVIETAEQQENTIEVASISVDRGETTSRFMPEDRANIDIEQTQELEEQEEIVVDEEVEETENYISIEDVTISVDMDLTQRTGLSKADFKTLMENCKYDTSGFFGENAELIYDVCEEYELNEIFFCGLISAESGWDIGYYHKIKCNYISMMSSSGTMKTYDSVEEGLRAAAKLLHNSYLTEGGSFYYGKTLSSVQKKFCPASSTWVNLVYGRMKQIL